MLITNKATPRIFIGAIIISLTLHLIFGIGLVLIKWLGYLFFIFALVTVVRNFFRKNKKATIIVIISIVAVSVSLQLTLGYGLGLLVWFAGLFIAYEVCSDIIRLRKERNASEE